MVPPGETNPQQDLYSALQSAGQNLGFCLLSFPIATWSGALLIGLWSRLSETASSDAPLWILLGVCVLLSAWAVFSSRSARLGLTRGGMPPHEVQRRISVVWIGVAVFMLAGGLCVLGYFVLVDPAEPLFPLEVTFILYVLAGALLLGRNWWELRKASATDGSNSADWFRQSELYSAHSLGEGTHLFAIATFLLALVIALGNGAGHGTDPGRLAIIGLFALGAWLCTLLARRSRRHFEGAGLSQEEVQDEVASTWRTGAVMMIILGAGGLACVIFAFDILTPADRPWSLGSALGYTAAGAFLYWRNRQNPRRGV
jgi:hypothetical protein